MIKVGVILPNGSGDLYKRIMRIANEMGISPIFGHGHFGTALDCAKKMLNDNPDIQAFIARNNTAIYFRDHIDIPTISLEITNFDIAKAISELEDKSGKFIIFQFEGGVLEMDVKGISQVCGIDIETVWVNPDKNNDFVKLSDEAGRDKVVASVSLVAEPCIAAGKTVCIVSISEEEIKRSLRRCLITIDIRTRETIKTQRFSQSLDTVGDGFIALDETGCIAVFNHKMEIVTGIDRREIIGLKQEEAVDRIQFLDDIFNAKDEDLIDINGERYSIGRESYMIEGLLLKDVFRVVSVPDIQKIEINLRKKLADSGFKAKNTFCDLFGCCQIMKDLKVKAEKYAKSSSSILITGESGTGKEVLAQSIHNASTYSEGPFVAINCAALPETLLESELFGYENGAFTGARRGGKTGLMELSNFGTLFLDEIGLMPLTFQAKLLRSIQEKQICRLGGSKLIPVQNRIICATNRDLLNDVNNGNFREDLYYRINVLSLNMPPLRERENDVIFLARRLLLKKCREQGKKIKVPDKYFEYLLSYSWPGNVRQLEGFIERLIVLTDGNEVELDTIKMLINEIKARRSRCDKIDQISLLKIGTIKDIENKAISEACKKFDNDVDKISQSLGMSRTTLWRRMKQLNEENHVSL